MNKSGKGNKKYFLNNKSASDLVHRLGKNDLDQFRDELIKLKKNISNIEAVISNARTSSFNNPVSHSSGKWVASQFKQKQNGGDFQSAVGVHSLSKREREVLIFVAQGLTDRQIGSKIFVSVNTVKTHLRRIFFKLEVKNRTEAALKIR